MEDILQSIVYAKSEFLIERDKLRGTWFNIINLNHEPVFEAYYVIRV